MTEQMSLVNSVRRGTNLLFEVQQGGLAPNA